MIEKDSQKIGNVIRIIDNRTIIVNVGKDVLNIGDNIKVYESLDILHDLDGSELSVFEYTKEILKVIDVEKYYSVCQKQETKEVVSTKLALSPLLARQESEYIPLNVLPTEIEPLEPKDLKIHVGDPVKLA